MVTFKENLRHSQKQHKQRQKENFASKDAIYNVLHFSDDMDKISEDKDPSIFLIGNAEKSQEDALVDLELEHLLRSSFNC